MNQDIPNAQLTLENWLAHPNELGHRPSKIEYTNQFVDESGNTCFIFKYKKTFFRKWLLGIVSESGTFSEMQRYSPDTEIADATVILNQLQEHWKQQAKLFFGEQ